MIQKTLLRQSRSLCSCIRSAPRTPLAQLQFRPANLAFTSSSRPFSVSRWRGAEEGAKKEGDAAAEVGAKAEEDPAKKELEVKNKEILDLKDKYLRSVAEFRNLQERTKRDIQTARDFAIQKFAKDLVESIDNLDRALEMVPADKRSSEAEHLKDLVALYDGLKMTESILMSTLKKHGLERFDPSEGSETFNPNEHEATFMAPQPDKEHNTVFHTQQKGFKLNGRVLRAAKVGVVKNQ